MSKYKITILSPLHISSGEEYELNYNLLEKDGYIYFYDEFKLVEFFIAKGIAVPSNINELQRVILNMKDAIIDSNLHLRKVESKFANIDKTVLENITTAHSPIVTGSSIKGSMRTAILDCIYNDSEKCRDIISLMHNKKLTTERLNNKGRVPYDNDFANIFKYLKVSDSLMPLETKIYKTINIKKEKSHQSQRQNKVQEIANYVEAIKPGQVCIVEIDDLHEKKIFKNMAWICNRFYIPFFKEDQEFYFSKKSNMLEKVKNAGKEVFILQVGRFGGAESKSLNHLRYIRASKAMDKSTTTTKTFALEAPAKDSIYFENELLPFGWIMIQKIDENNTVTEEMYQQKKRDLKKLNKQKFDAIDNLNNINKETRQKRQEALLEKKRKEETEKQRIAQEQQAKEAKLAAMTPLERKIEELLEANSNKTETVDIVIFNALKKGDLNEYKCEALQKLKIEMQNLKKWVETSNKPEKDKKYKRTQEVMQMLKECNQ